MHAGVVRAAARRGHGRLAKPEEAVNQSGAVVEADRVTAPPRPPRGGRSGLSGDAGRRGATPTQANAMVAGGYRALVDGFDWSPLQRGCAAAIEGIAR
jgi:hypothetical protein